MRLARLLLLSALLAPAVPAEAQHLLITGRTVNAETGAAVAARVEAPDLGVSVTAGADGRFVLDAGPVGRATLVVSCPGYYVQRTLVQSAAPLDIRLVPVITLSDRVEVTAGRAREGADPATFSNVPRQAIADAHWGQDPAILLSALVPGVFARNDSGNGIGYSYFSIRGFGQARTRVTLNGAPINDAESGELFFVDLADFMTTAGDVQVRRGVAGLTGLGGAVDVTTAQPSVEPGFSLDAGAGSFGTSRLSLVWESGLLNGAWALSARYSKIRTDGYRDQAWVDMWNYYVSIARYGGRSRLRAVLFGGPEDAHLAYDGIDRATLEGGVTGDADRDRRTNPLSYPGEIDHFFQPHYQIVHDVRLSERTSLDQTLYAFRGTGYYDQFRARRWLVEYGLPDAALPDGTSVRRTDLVRRRSVDEWDVGWVPKLSHRAGRVALDLTGEWRWHRAHHTGEVRWAQFLPAGAGAGHRYYDYRVGKQTATAAMTAKADVTPRITASAGFQLSRHAYELFDDRLKGVAFTRAYGFVLPRAGVVVKLADGADAYATAARGMREPFFRNIYDPQDYYATGPADLDSEDVWNVETGTSWRRGRWRARANAYWMHFRNEIVYAGALDDNGVPVYGNGARSRRLGLEVDAGATVSSRIGVEAAVSLARNTFLRYREHDWEGGTAVYDGKRAAGFPGVMASAAAHANLGPARVSLSLRHVGRFYLDNTENAGRVNDAWTTADAVARVGLPARALRTLGLDRWALDLRVNNLLDRRYTSFGYVDGGVPLYIPAAGRSVYAGFSLGF